MSNFRPVKPHHATGRVLESGGEAHRFNAAIGARPRNFLPFCVADLVVLVLDESRCRGITCVSLAEPTVVNVAKHGATAGGAPGTGAHCNDTLYAFS
jgi:hypothetical protein